MRKTLDLILAAALSGGFALSAAPSEAVAGPLSAASPTLLRPAAPVENVYYRRYYHRRYYGHRYYGYGYDPSGAIFAGAALGLLGAGIAASQPHYYYYGYPAYGWGYPGYYGWGW